MSLDLDQDFDCPHCATVLTATEAQAGTTMACTGCGHAVVVPGGDRQQASQAATRATRPCPHCGKAIGAVDQRCKHCDGWTGIGDSPEKTRAIETHLYRTVGKGSITPSMLDYALGLVTPYLAAPLGVYYLLVGQHKRGVMLLMWSLMLCIVHFAALEYVREHYPMYAPF